MPESFGENLNSMEQLAANAEPRIAEQPMLLDVWNELRNVLTEIRDLRTRQLETRATGQSLTKEIVTKMDRARDLAARLRTGLATMFGKRDERLVEFGMKPLRRRARKSPVETPVEDVASTGPTPTSDVS